MRLPKPPARYDEFYERERNRLIEFADAENIKLPTLENALRWGTLNRLFPEINVRHLGAKVDGATDDTTAILAAVEFGILYNIPVLIPGTTVMSSPITDASGRLVLKFNGAAGIRYDGSADDWIIQFTTQRSAIHGYFLLAANVAGDNYTFNGIKCSSSASRVVVRGFPQLYRMKNALKFVTVYGCEAEVDITECAEIGVDFDSEANANTVWAQEITGKTSVYGTKGIRNNGRGNIVKGQQLSEWTHAYYGVAYSTGTLLGHYIEVNTTAIELEAGASLVSDCAEGLDGIIVPDGASLTTPFGNNHTSGMGYVPAAMVPTRGLTAYYPMVDTSTTEILDYSGNGRTATVSGSMTNTTGPYGNAKSFATGSVMLVPVSAITYNAAWSAAVLIQHGSWNSGTNTTFQVVEGSNKIRLEAQQNNYNLAAYRNSSSVGNLGDRKSVTDIWEWVCIGYDPASGGTIYNLNPALVSYDNSQSLTLSNPLTTTPSSIQVGSTSNGTIVLGSVAIWDRVLSKTEMLHWCNQLTPPMVPSAVMVNGGQFTKGTTSVADGGTITHGLGTTPAQVFVQPVTSGEMVDVTAIGSTTFTVAIKKHDNTAGTTQSVHWLAFK